MAIINKQTRALKAESSISQCPVISLNLFIDESGLLQYDVREVHAKNPLLRI